MTYGQVHEHTTDLLTKESTYKFLKFSASVLRASVCHSQYKDSSLKVHQV